MFHGTTTDSLNFRPYIELYTLNGENKEFGQGINNITPTKSKQYSGNIGGISFYTNEGKEFNNFKFKLQITKSESINPSEYINHEEQTFTIPVQQDMLKGDYLDFEKMEEVHKWNKIVFDENSNITCKHNTNNEVFEFEFSLLLPDANNHSKCICNISKFWRNLWNENGCFVNYRGHFYLIFKDTEFGFTQQMTIDEAISHLKERLKETNLVINYTYTNENQEITKSITFTDEQKQIAEQIKELHAYKGITNIYSTDVLSPIFEVETIKDTKKYIDTKIAEVQALILEGGV